VRLAEKFEEVADYVRDRPQGASSPANQNSGLADLPAGDLADAIRARPTELSPDLLADLPAELIAELNITDTDRFEANVLRLINSVPGKTMLLDNIIIGLYLATGEKYTRVNLTNKLYRMARKDKLHPLPGKKGVYTTIRPQTSEQQEQPELDGLIVDTAVTTGAEQSYGLETLLRATKAKLARMS
jgi:hypothetical protein